MTTKQATPVVAAAPADSHKLAPAITSKAKAKSVAAAGGRKRAIVAINEDGKLVVCCRRTAKKNGWDIQEVLYERAKTVKAEAPVVPAPKKGKLQKAVEAEMNSLLGL